MRRAFLLILLALAPACRRSPPPPPAVAPGIAPAATTDAAPVAPVPEAPPPAASSPAPPPEQPSPPREASEPARDAPTAATAAPQAPEPAADEPEDTRIYSWTDERGTVHFGTAAEAPPETRRAVEGGVTVVPVRSYGASTDASAPTPGAGAGAAPEPEPEPLVRGARPQLDAQGLPIPGTMDDTAHTRAVQQATGVQLDPASVERRRAIESRRMNCVEKDGGTFCSGE